MGMSIWSATERAMLSFPARFFVEFFDKHGFLSVNNRPGMAGHQGRLARVHAQAGGALPHRIRLNTAGHLRAARIRRASRFAPAIGTTEAFRLRVLRLPQRPGARRSCKTRPTTEADVLGAFPYQENEAVLHTDDRLLPRALRSRAPPGTITCLPCATTPCATGSPSPTT